MLLSLDPRPRNVDCQADHLAHAVSQQNTRPTKAQDGSQIWFGSSYLGFSSSESFHPVFGPIILIGYAALCNVVLITVLIGILSNEWSQIAANSQAEVSASPDSSN